MHYEERSQEIPGYCYVTPNRVQALIAIGQFGFWNNIGWLFEFSQLPQSPNFKGCRQGRIHQLLGASFAVCTDSSWSANMRGLLWKNLDLRASSHWSLGLPHYLGVICGMTPTCILSSAGSVDPSTWTLESGGKRFHGNCKFPRSFRWKMKNK